MQTITKEFELYKFSELSVDAKLNAIAEYTKDGLNYEWWDGVYNLWTEKLNELGFENIEINFSGFWSQGDGASFTAKVDLIKYLKSHNLDKKFNKCLENTDNIEISIYRSSHHYSHENTIDVEVLDYSSEDLTDGQLDSVHVLLREEIKDLSKQIYKDLEAEYEYLTSEEFINETSEANEWQYLESGKLFA